MTFPATAPSHDEQRLTASVGAHATRPRWSPRLESLRGLAALAVLTAHSYGWAHGYTAPVFTTVRGRIGIAGGFGLHVFFALSGYLLFLPFVRSSVAGRQVSLRRYLKARALRVLPLYWVVIAVFLLTLHHGVPHREWWRFPLLLQGFWPDTVATVDGPAWTLAVEVQFYLLLPVVAWLLLRRGLASATAGLLLAVAALVPLRIVGVDLRPESSLRWAYSLPANDVFFLPGMLLALGVAARESGALTVRAPAWLARADVLLVAAFACFAGAVADFRFSILAGLGSGLLLAAVALPLRSTPVLRLLDLRGVVFLGAISYGVYLWHEPLIARLHHAGLGGGTLILLVVGAAVAVAASAVSHVLVERPFLRLKDRQRR